MMIKIRVSNILITGLVVLLLMTSQSATATVDSGVFEGNSYDFTFTEGVELTSADDTSSEDASEEVSYSIEFTDVSEEDDDNDLAKILAVQTVEYGGTTFSWSYSDNYFSLSTTESDKMTSVSTTNVTIYDGVTGSLSLDTDPTGKLPLFAPSDFIVGINPSAFNFDPENITSGYEETLETYLDDTATGDFDEEINLDGTSLEYSVSGTVDDTYGFVDESGDDDKLSVEGGFTLEYDSDGALKTYELEYTFTFEDVDIVVYSESMSSGGFFAGISSSLPGFGFYLVMTSLLAIPIIRKFRYLQV